MQRGGGGTSKVCDQKYQILSEPLDRFFLCTIFTKLYILQTNLSKNIFISWDQIWNNWKNRGKLFINSAGVRKKERARGKEGEKQKERESEREGGRETERSSLRLKC